ncbi:MAG: hypothetical protein IKK21_06170 [Clostridia bacterium]|nr:hypothetical protein [Clostridia bacterium]
MLNILNAENPSQSISLTDESGNRTDIMHISCNLRPGSGLHLNIEMFDAAKVAANMDAVQEALTTFVTETFARASSMGLPVPSLGGDANA